VARKDDDDDDDDDDDGASIDGQSKMLGQNEKCREAIRSVKIHAYTRPIKLCHKGALSGVSVIYIASR
jgi:hypothetical protein